MEGDYEARYCNFETCKYHLLAKSEDLKKQIDILKQTHLRQLNCKNIATENLSHDLFEAEEQFSTALQAQLINIDTLNDLQKSRLENIKAQFETDLDILEAEFNSERLLFSL